MIVKAILAKLSLCECGYTVQRDNVPLGTKYTVETETIHQATMVCGNCGKLIRCHSIFAFGGVSQSSGTMPLEILELDEGNYDSSLPNPF